MSGWGKAGEEPPLQLCGVPWLCLIWAGRWRLWQKTKLTQKRCKTCSTETPVCVLSAFPFTSVRIRHWGSHVGWESFGVCTHLTVTVCPCLCDQLARAYQKLEAAEIFNKRYGMFSAFKIYILKKERAHKWERKAAISCKHTLQIKCSHRVLGMFQRSLFYQLEKIPISVRNAKGSVNDRNK